MYETELVPDQLPQTAQLTRADRLRRIALFFNQHADYENGIFFPPSAVVLTREDHNVLRTYLGDNKTTSRDLGPKILKPY